MDHPIDPKTARERKGLSREQVAVNASIAYHTVCRCEQSGKFPARPLCRRRYLSALGLTEADITPKPVRGAR